MAVIEKLADVDGNTLYDFTTGALKIRQDSWNTEMSMDGNYTESMMLVTNAKDDSIISAVQSIDEAGETARLFHSGAKYKKSVWFYVSATSETSKRALIYDIIIRQVEKQKYTHILGTGGAFFDLVITRGPWENSTISTTLAGGSISCLGGTMSLTAIGGALPGRIARFQVKGCYGGGSPSYGGGPIYTCWAGIRPLRHGVADFNPVWEAELGDLSYGGASAVGTATASGGTAVAIDFSGTATLTRRLLINVSDVAGSNYAHFIGDYVVLMRYKCDANSTNGYVQMNCGYPLNAAFSEREPRAFGGTASNAGDYWRLLEMGNISIPTFPWRSALTDAWVSIHNLCKSFTIEIEAQRDSAGGTLLIDNFILIPAEHYIKSQGSYIQYINYDAELEDEDYTQTIHAMSEDGRMSVIYQDENSEPKSSIVANVNEWFYPIEGGVLVFAGERDGAQITTDLVDLDLLWFPRHRTFGE